MKPEFTEWLLKAPFAVKPVAKTKINHANETQKPGKDSGRLFFIVKS